MIIETRLRFFVTTVSESRSPSRGTAALTRLPACHRDSGSDPAAGPRRHGLWPLEGVPHRGHNVYMYTHTHTHTHTHTQTQVVVLADIADVTYVYDDVTCVYDDVTCVYDDVTHC